jgi:hypothetical protein
MNGAVPLRALIAFMALKGTILTLRFIAIFRRSIHKYQIAVHIFKE